jgi:virulence factor Mce-like protein
MRRVLGLAALLAAAAVVFVLAGVSGTEGNYRVDAVFDNADFLITGQDVKVAGARVGTVARVTLTSDRKARVEMRIDPGFAPFRANSECSIRPQSLIGEKFVDCAPGTPAAPPLGKNGGAPTVPLAHTHSPVDLDVVFAALRLPLRQRLSVVVNELGTGLAGRPQELNDAIRRANPALQRTAHTLSILADERHTLGRLIDASDRVLARLASRRRQVSDFIVRAHSVTRTLASRRGDLDLAIRRLPPLLQQLQPAAVDLTGVAVDARPIVRALGDSAPNVTALLNDLKPVSDAVRPALVRLNALTPLARRAVRAAGPVARLLDPVTQRLVPIVGVAQPLVDSLRDHHAIEAIGPYLFYSAIAAARFDKVSHILPSYQIAGTCQQFAEQPVSGCNAHFAGMGATRSAAAGQRAKSARAGARSAATRRRQGSPRRRQSVSGGELGIVQRAADAAGLHPGDRARSGGLSSQLLGWLLGP